MKFIYLGIISSEYVFFGFEIKEEESWLFF